MSAPAAELPHSSGSMSEDQAFERILARNSGPVEAPADTDPASDSEDDAPQAEFDDAQVEGEEFPDDGETEVEVASDPMVRFDDGTELAMSEVKRGYLRQQDYTRKTQETAELRKAVDSERAQFIAEKRQAADNLNPLIEQAIAIIQAQANNPELLSLRQTDPGEYMVRVREIEQNQARMQQLAWQQNQLRESAAREEHARAMSERAQTAAASKAVLVEKIPAFKKDFDAEYRRLGQYVLEQGIPAELWDNEVDHRVITLAWKAMQHDAATRKTPETKQKLQKAPQHMRPGAAKPPGYAQARALKEATERAYQSGSIDDMAALRLLKNRTARR